LAHRGLNPTRHGVLDCLCIDALKETTNSGLAGSYIKTGIRVPSLRDMVRNTWCH